MKPNLKIFLVDDDPMFCRSVEMKLGQLEGFFFISCGTGEEVMDYVNLDPDIIIMDYYLPGMTGLETLEEIRKVNQNAKVIFVSSDAQLEETCREAGADFFIHKRRGDVNEIYDIVKRIGIILQSPKKDLLHQMLRRFRKARGE